MRSSSQHSGLRRLVLLQEHGGNTAKVTTTHEVLLVFAEAALTASARLCPSIPLRFGPTSQLPHLQATSAANVGGALFVPE